MKLLTTSNPKTAKGEAFGYRTAILHLAPYDRSRVANVCPDSTSGCRSVCLYWQGRGSIPKVQSVRVERTRMLVRDPAGFYTQLCDELAAHVRASDRRGLAAAVRLNGTSDLAWERLFPSLFEAFDGVRFYDYTKSVGRMLEFLRARHLRRRNAWVDIEFGRIFPRNYHLTLSRSEESDQAQLRAVLSMGGNVAVVFRDEAPTTFLDAPTVDGDRCDLRFTDPEGSIVALTAKGTARRDRTGFVVWHSPGATYVGSAHAGRGGTP